MAAQNVDFGALRSLLQSPRQEFVLRFCNEAFLQRNALKPSLELVKTCQDALSVDKEAAQNLVSEMTSLIKLVLYRGLEDSDSILKLFPENFHKNLKTLLVKILVANIEKWKQHVLTDTASLPRLVDFQWRVDLKLASDRVSRMSVPTCLLQLEVEQPFSADSLTGTDTVTVELSKETLATVLDGLGRIRDQLSAVAAK